MADTTHTIEQDVIRIKEDVASLKMDMVRVKEDIAGIKSEMKYFATKEDIAGIKSKMESFATKADLEHMGRTLIMWHISSMIALAGVITAIFRFMR